MAILEVMKDGFSEKLILQEKAEWSDKASQMKVRGKLLENREVSAESLRWDHT